MPVGIYVIDHLFRATSKGGMLATLRSAIPSFSSKATTDMASDGTQAGKYPKERPDWDNLSVLHRNTLPPRSTFYIYDSEKNALARDVSKRKAHCLSGQWQFHLANSPLKAPEGFEDPSFNASKWSKITVPGMWQSQGFGRGPQYTNVQYPFNVDPPHPPYMDNECGSYIAHFKVPAHLRGHQLRLRFEGVDSSFHVYVNGKEVGYSQGSRNPSEFDITELVDERGDNVLAVRVYQFCDGSYIEDQVSEVTHSSKHNRLTPSRTNGGSAASFGTFTCSVFQKPCI